MKQLLTKKNVSFKFHITDFWCLDESQVGIERKRFRQSRRTNGFSSRWFPKKKNNIFFLKYAFSHSFTFTKNLGIYLIKVLEVIFDKDCEQTVGKKYNRKPTLVSHKIDNVSLAIEFLSKCVTYKLNIEPKGNSRPHCVRTTKLKHNFFLDIVDKNMKVTLGLLWRLVSQNMLENPENDTRTVAQRKKRPIDSKFWFFPQHIQHR